MKWTVMIILMLLGKNTFAQDPPAVCVKAPQEMSSTSSSSRPIAKSGISLLSANLNHAERKTQIADLLLSKKDILTNEGFTCTPPPETTVIKNETAWKCVGKLPSYPKNVAIYIPADFQIKQTPVLNFYLHGYLQKDTPTFEDTLKKYDIGKALQRSRMNSIVVEPESEDLCKTYESNLSDRFQLKRLTTDALNWIEEAGLSQQPAKQKPVASRIFLSGHSGSYSAIGKILASSCPFPFSPGCDYMLDSDNRLAGVNCIDGAYWGRISPKDPNYTTDQTITQQYQGLATKSSLQFTNYYIKNSPTEKASLELEERLLKQTSLDDTQKMVKKTEKQITLDAIASSPQSTVSELVSGNKKMIAAPSSDINHLQMPQQFFLDALKGQITKEDELTND